MKNSRNQSPSRAYYRSHIIPMFQRIIMDSSGESITEEQLHELLKLKCNPRVKIFDNENPITFIPGSTKHFSEQEHWEYNQRCKAWIEAYTVHAIR